MKIKTKKQLNLPQLIEWGFENDISCRFFESNRSDIKGKVFFDNNGMVDIQISVCKNETFTVEVEEEITEDTALDKLYHTTTLSRIVESGCSTIKSTLEHSTVEPIAFYMLNDDLTMTLIWRDGELVE